jgi:hypothetical protein
MGGDDEPGDDATIRGSDPLWRRIHPDQVLFDRNLGGWRPSSAAFGDHPNGTPMSVVLGNEVIGAGRSAAALLDDYTGYSLAGVTAGLARSCDQIVYRAPRADEPAHAEVKGTKTKGVKRKFATEATWVLLRGQAGS